MSVTSSKNHWDYLWPIIIGAAALFLFAWGSGGYAFWDPWEPRYAQTVKEMLERSDFITPYFKDEIRWTKPILIYWAMALPISILGNNEFAARLPSVLAAVLGVLFTYFFLWKLHGRRTAILGASILATIPQYFYLARQAMPDMLLTCFLITTMGFFALGRFGTSHKRLTFGLFYASVSLAFLTKGPVACAITCGAIGIFWLIDLSSNDPFPWKDLGRQLAARWSDYHVTLGILIFIAVSAPWYLTIWIKHGSAFIDHFIVGQNIHRFQAPAHDLSGLLNYYVRTFFHGMYPWAGFLPLSVCFLFSGKKEVDEETRQTWYYLSWLLAVGFIFTFSATKLDHYLLPATPAVAVLVALVWKRYLSADAPFWLRPVFLLSLLFACLPLRDFLSSGNENVLSTFNPQIGLGRHDEGVETALLLIFGAWAVVTGLCVFIPRSRWLTTLAILVAFSNGIYCTQVLVPARSHEHSLKNYTELYDRIHEPNAQLVVYGSLRDSVTYYYGLENFQHFEADDLDLMLTFLKYNSNVYIIAEGLVYGEMWQKIHEPRRKVWHVVSDEHPLYALITDHPPPSR